MDYFKDKISIVTGGASGIGRAYCHELGRRGAVVMVTDINAGGAEKVAEEVNSAGGKAEAAHLDVTKADDVKKIVEDTASKHGRLDFMFNNAGIVVVGELRYTLLEDWHKLIDVNLMGVVHGIHAAYPLMIKQGHGHIVNTASCSGYAPVPMFPAYGAIKHAIVGISAKAAVEGAGLGVKVSAVCPSVVATPVIGYLTYRGPRREGTPGPNPTSMITPEECATLALEGVEREKVIIPIGKEGKLYYYLYRFLPGYYMKKARGTIAAVRKHLQKQ